MSFAQRVVRHSPVVADTRKMTYEEAKALYEEVINETARLGHALKEFPRTAMGLVPDEIRKTPAYQKAKQSFDRAFRKQQDVAKWFVKTYAKEYKADRNRRRGL